MESLSKKEKVLITGIEGFTGDHLKKHLVNSNFEVEGTSIQNSPNSTYHLDITDIDRIKEVLIESRPDYIIHLAAISFTNIKEKLTYYDVNTLGTQKLIEAILQTGLDLKKLLIPSSATVYGNQKSFVLDEGMDPKPNNHYACSKYSMECIVRNFFEEIPIIVTRPFNYTGPGQDESFIIPKIIKHFQQNKGKIELGNLKVYREFNDVEYICKIYERLLSVAQDSLIVNVSSNIIYSINDVLEILEQITDHRIKVVVNPRFVRKNEIKKLSGSISHLSSIIEMPNPIPLELTIQKMLIS